MTGGSIRAALGDAERALGGADAKRDAELLLLHAMQKSRAWLYAHSDECLDASTAMRFEESLARRKTGEPIAYLTGSREFWSLDLAVNPHVLIPRPETELLVESALQHLPQSEEASIVDLGTGSGAIALAIARERPRSRVLAIDVSDGALDIARSNAAKNGISNVDFAHGDWFASFGDRRFDLIVSNPPYVAQDDPHLDQGDLRFEPRNALVSGVDGLDAIRSIIDGAPNHLKSDGWLLLEHGFDQGAPVREILMRRGFKEVSTAKDLEGRDRVSAGVYRG